MSAHNENFSRPSNPPFFRWRLVYIIFLTFLKKENAIKMNPRQPFEKSLSETCVPGRLHFPIKNLDDLPFEDGSNRVAFVVHPLGDESRA